MPRATSKSPARKRASSSTPKAASSKKGDVLKKTHFDCVEITKGKGWWGRENAKGGYTKYDNEILHSFTFSWALNIGLWISVPSLILYYGAQYFGYALPEMDLMHVGKTVIIWVLLFALCFLPVFAFSMKTHSQLSVQVCGHLNQ